MRNAAKLAVVFAALWLFATNADAQRIDPRCMTMREDKIGCTCALENGGGVGEGPASGIASDAIGSLACNA